MVEEFKKGDFGSELRLRSLLMELLVSLVRWEESDGRYTVPHLARANWTHIQKALHYMHEHHTEAIYVRQVAQALRVGERQLNGLFRELLGMGCIQYLNEYRVSLAASMLSTSAVPITAIAFKVGFETLSHFNTTFRKVIGMSPTEYVGRKKSSRLTA
jgi:transcriptional regulator GlxA family with amidase domain